MHRGKYGSPLYAAVKHERIEMIQYLLQKGICPNAGPAHDALDSAAALDHERIVRMLVAYGADVDCGEDDNNYSPMLSALVFERDHVVKTLLELGARKIDTLSGTNVGMLEWLKFNRHHRGFPEV